MNSFLLSSDLCDILKDERITITQKYILLAILGESTIQNAPDVLELPVKVMESYGVRGHGHIKGHLNKLQEVGYLLEVGKTGREDGYSVTAVRINQEIFQRRITSEVTVVELLPEQPIFSQDVYLEEDTLEA